MRRAWFALICLFACSLSACFGQINYSAKEDDYVFCRGAWKYTSKGKQLGRTASEVEVDGQLKPVTLEGKAAYRKGGAIYFSTNVEGESGRFLCYSRAGDASWKILARDNASPYGLSGGGNPYTKIAWFEGEDGKRRFLRDGEIVDVDEGTLVCPEGDGRVVEKDGNAFYVEGERQWELPGFVAIVTLHGWTLYYGTSDGNHAFFDMRSKTSASIEGKHHFAQGHPFSVKKTEGGTLFCRWDGEGRAEERFLEVDFPAKIEYAGGDGVFRLSASIGAYRDEWVYDYAFDKLTHCEEGRPSVYRGDFSYYEDEEYRFYVRITAEQVNPDYRRLNKKTGEDEFLYRPMATLASGGTYTGFPRVDWVIAPTKD